MDQSGGKAARRNKRGEKGEIKVKKIWINKANSFKEAEEFDIHYYMEMSKTERLETMQFLREIYGKMKDRRKYESRKGLRRFIKII